MMAAYLCWVRWPSCNSQQRSSPFLLSHPSHEFKVTQLAVLDILFGQEAASIAATGMRL